ncbi:PrsW family intramembrane metalloprotease [Dactylosporangium sp. NBC_01737]|uniref:PrsW family intramembrane metalloprotease n=1 Tax=Dactylosporangium sp. NBC_01737 TaxID=2975959 RepID=UPI002E0F850E|nr:PrsW family intramembrane metalloprotease [Dactylosporangium sp. NBC_01737]
MTELPPSGTPSEPGRHDPDPRDAAWSPPAAPAPVPAPAPAPAERSPWASPLGDQAAPAAFSKPDSQAAGEQQAWNTAGADVVPNVTEESAPDTGEQRYPTAALALAAAPPAKRSDRRRLWTLIGVMGGIAACGVALLAFFGFSGGWTALVIGVAAAVIPVPVLVSCFLWLDRYEPEPVRYLVFVFGWGACVATAVALVVNTAGGVLADRLGLSESIVAVLVAPVIEESMKALGPILLFWRRPRAFSGLIDGIVYCGLSATGFAMVENILYLGFKGYADTAEDAGPVNGAVALVAIFVVRILMTGFAHPLFTSMTGIGLGIASRSSTKAVRWLAPIAGLLLAMLLHGSWNLMSVTASASAWVLLYGYFAVMMPIFLCMVGFALWQRSNEGKLTERMLTEYARAGWFSPPEVAALGTLGRRLSARRWARRVAGDHGAKAMKAFQFDATKLALLRDGLHRGLDNTPARRMEALAEERHLLSALAAYRQVFVGRDPQAPLAVWDGSRYHITFPDGMVRVLAAPPTPVVPVPVVVPPPPPPVPMYAGYPYPYR